MTRPLSVPGLPTLLRSINQAGAAHVSGDALTIRAAAKTDWFVDPAGASVTHSAPALVMPAAGSWMLISRVSADHRATFDAAALVIPADQENWAKLCLELSPGGEVMVVSVVTRGESDDSNSVPVEGGEVWLRISSLGRAFAFHASSDGQRWDPLPTSSDLSSRSAVVPHAHETISEHGTLA